MKQLFTTMLLLAAIGAFAQSGSNLTRKNTVGGYGALHTGITAIGGHASLMAGGYGGVLLDRKYMLGLGLNAMGNMIKKQHDGLDRNWHMWYTGLAFEYTHQTDKKFHWSAGALVGGGNLTERMPWNWGKDWEELHNWNEDRVVSNYGFYAIEPFVNLEMNLNKHMRLFASGKYRRVFGSGSDVLTDSKLSSPTFSIGIKAGKF
ncbi:hypothetical protein [Chitinophaga solisilvae]|uniref:hypothetical protein n=1 Tax=Chitinophaga solisilvae TaxID=1233460 RepID=UPI00136A89D3|nr:hypothetical protein [Chitinophaga solisilvae]